MSGRRWKRGGWFVECDLRLWAIGVGLAFLPYDKGLIVVLGPLAFGWEDAE